ncbi:MAG: hypothetical protein U0871_00380 [Gemmataceae bacterium]
MSRPRLLAHVVVVSADVSRWGGTTTLIGVDYAHQLPADTEFPRTVRKLDVFTRFFVYGGGPETVRVEVWWLSPDGTDRQLVHGYNHEVPFDPTESVRDWVFRLTNVRLPGEGRYAVRVCRLVRTRARGLHWRPLRADYFQVARAS